ncbi:MAG: SDR family oxidoreductase [Opitutaceae bacterium]|nr:SDR family oxidoreductase [Opitutaceae bacterium]
MPTLLDQFRLAGKTALVTGGSRGLGRACAVAMAEAGADVAIVDLPGAESGAVLGDIRALGRRALALSCDVTRSPEVEAAVAAAVAEFGGVDILLNNAGICIHQPAESMSDDQWLKVVNVDLNAVFYVARAVGRAMIARGGGGRIINTASMSGRIVNRPQAQCAYNAAKAGVIQLTRSLACEWAAHGITVNSISPGYTATEMTMTVPHLHPGWIADTPMKRLAQPSEIAFAVVFLAAPGATFITGHDLVVDGGFSCW